jgi:hypothetical protein
MNARYSKKRKKVRAFAADGFDRGCTLHPGERPQAEQMKTGLQN